ncbi:hypothetical protein [Nocardia jiangsuensis]|uniref:Uncharacterized protein n=1 Tax=Nocardia jiangsuensis TaxID=1691563 RepID=A0ABV8DQJ5_9NOCA
MRTSEARDDLEGIMERNTAMAQALANPCPSDSAEPLDVCNTTARLLSDDSGTGSVVPDDAGQRNKLQPRLDENCADTGPSCPRTLCRRTTALP